VTELFHALGTYPDVLKTFIVCGATIVGLILFIIASKLGWLKSMKLGKGGLEVEASEKKLLEKKFESGNLHHIMNQQIHKVDIEILEYSLDKSNGVRKGLAKQLNTKIFCVSSRRALAACLRYPLYESARRNNFKYSLRPENMKFYIDRLMKELASEYEEYSVEVDNNTCPVDLKQNCKPVPPLEEVFDGVRQQIIDHWALPLRHEQIKMHYKKIDIYRQYTPLFEQLNDKVMVKVCENCIDKNIVYAEALKRKPEPHEL